MKNEEFLNKLKALASIQFNPKSTIRKALESKSRLKRIIIGNQREKERLYFTIYLNQ